MSYDMDASLWSKGHKYLLVDAGGGTVDIACHEIVDAKSVKEVMHPSGGAWGSRYIDAEFEGLLAQVFGAAWMGAFRAAQANVHVELMDNFQATKQGFYHASTRDRHTYDVALPFEFVGFMQDRLEETDSQTSDLAQLVAKSTVFGKSGLVSLEEDSEEEYVLRVHTVAWKTMFDAVIAPLSSQMSALLCSPAMSRGLGVRYLCLVGGLSTSPYFVGRLEQAFGAKSRFALTLVVPQRPILSVVEGAAYLGITEGYIKARILRLTYGLLQNVPEAEAKAAKLPADYIARHRFFNPYIERWCVKACFKVIARKNEEVHPGQIKTRRARRMQPSQRQVATKIVWSPLLNPMTERDANELGTVLTEFPTREEDDMELTTEFHFGDTVIKAVVFRDKYPSDKQTHYITNFK